LLDSGKNDFRKNTPRALHSLTPPVIDEKPLVLNAHFPPTFFYPCPRTRSESVKDFAENINRVKSLPNGENPQRTTMICQACRAIGDIRSVAIDEVEE